MLLITELSGVTFFCLAIQSLWKKCRWAREHWRNQEIRTSGFLIVAVLGEEHGPNLECFCHYQVLSREWAFQSSPLRIVLSCSDPTLGCPRLFPK